MCKLHTYWHPSALPPPYTAAGMVVQEEVWLEIKPLVP